MIHYVDSEEEWEKIQHSDYLDFVMELKEKGIIRHIGMSSHNPKVAMKAAESGYVEMILFSINPAFDMLPASENIDTMFADEFDAGLKGTDPDRAKLYKTCEDRGHERICGRKTLRCETFPVRRLSDSGAVYSLCAHKTGCLFNHVRV